MNITDIKIRQFTQTTAFFNVISKRARWKKPKTTAQNACLISTVRESPAIIAYHYNATEIPFRTADSDEGFHKFGMYLFGMSETPFPGTLHWRLCGQGWRRQFLYGRAGL